MPARFRSPAAQLRVGLGLLLAISMGGCLTTDWDRAVEEDTPAAYYRYLREHRDSKHAAQAQERIDFHKLRRAPSLAGFDAFRAKYPETTLADELLPALEAPAFTAARAKGTAEAYRDFLASFTRGVYAARAAGNALYIETAGFGGDPDQLASFAENYRESDFAAEAQRTADAVAARRSGGFERIDLVLEVAADTPEAGRVRAALAERIGELTARLGIETVTGAGPGTGAKTASGARLEVRHEERSIESAVQSTTLTRSTRQATTELVLREQSGGAEIARRSFELRVDDKQYVPGTSLLFSAAAPRYWAEFFVPVAHWRNDQAIRPELALDRSVVDVAAAGDRVAVLYDDGDFDLIGLEDPVAPVKLAEYRRAEHLQKWTGIEILGDRIAIFGEEGLEIVRFTEEGPVAERSWGRGEIGRVLSIADLGSELVLVGTNGMQAVDPDVGRFRLLMRRVMLSVAAAGKTLVFVDGESVYLSTPDLLAQNRVIGQMKLGRTFGPKRVRVLDRTAIVIGPGGALVIDLTNASTPRTVAQFSAREIGEVSDAARVRGRTFLVGERGMQVLDRSLSRVEEVIDVGARRRLTVMGRHLVAADGVSLRVVDSTPWAAVQRPAAAAP